jgi:hypothetical protein
MSIPQSTVGSLALALVISACASTGGGETRYRSDELTREEIMSVDVRDLYEVVQRLRPRWLTADRRHGDTPWLRQMGVVVYQGQTQLGDINVLKQLSPDAAYKLKWLDGSTASATLPGLGSTTVAGAIVISTGPTR